MAIQPVARAAAPLALAASLALALAGCLTSGSSAGDNPLALGPEPFWEGPLGGPPVQAPVPVTMAFGIDANSVDELAAMGIEPRYGTLWVGKWTLDNGWRRTDATLDALAAQNVTPLVEFYYWGNDIRSACFTTGCNGKGLAGWTRLETQLAPHLQDHLHGAPAVVVLETEFNKDQVKQDETLDGLLAQKALDLKAGYPPVRVALGLGNWYSKAWGTWDRAAAASDLIGLQALAGSTAGDDPSRLFATTLQGAQTAHKLFDRPIIVHDIGVSSYPEPAQLAGQQAALQGFANGLADLQTAGVTAIAYRSLRDVPNMPTNEHFGEGERHWGLAWSNGTLKPGGETLLGAMQSTAA